MKEKESNSFYWAKAVIVVVVLVSLSYFFINRSNNKLLENDYGFTEAEIVNFRYNNYAYCLEYEYLIGNKEYKNSVCGMSKFYSSEGVLGCVGYKFIVKYSKSNPIISEIDLKGFNKYKPIKP